MGLKGLRHGGLGPYFVFPFRRRRGRKFRSPGRQKRSSWGFVSSVLFPCRFYRVDGDIDVRFHIP